MKTYVTSDLHINHENILIYEPKNRPFKSVDQMHEYMIDHWNQIVDPQDTVYILGDVGFKSVQVIIDVLKQLNGNLILIAGNHDHYWLQIPEFRQCFTEIHQYHEIKHNKRDIIMFHYPVLEWNKCYYGSIMLHGHLHSHPSKLENFRIRNVGWDYTGKVVSLLDDVITDALTSQRRQHGWRGEVSEIENSARIFATAAHSSIKQVRKYTGEPYIVHPTQVVEILREYTQDPAILAAAWMHDVIEDTGVTDQDILHEFGDEITELVLAVTDVSQPSDGNREQRKLKDLNHLKLAPSKAKMIKLADIISNITSIAEHDPNFAKIYFKEKRAQLQVLTNSNELLYNRCLMLVEQLESNL